MDFLFLNSSFHTKRKDKIQTVAPHLRIGVASIAAYLKGLGARVSILDPQAQALSAEDLVSEILSNRPRYLCLPAYTEELEDAAGVAEMVKAGNSDITTIIGGYHVSALPFETLREFSCFDAGVVGEGERVLRDIFRQGDLETVPGIVYRVDSGEPVLNEPRRDLMPLDDLPFLAWDLYDLEKYGDTLPIEPLRACPFGCVFCFRVLGRKVVYKSPERFVEELQYYISRYGVTSFRFLAGTFPLNREHAIEIFERILSKGLEITWEASTRVDVVSDYKLVKLMKMSGCISLQLGVESGDPDILRYSAKGISPEESLETARLCKKAGIRVGLNFIIGLPFETHSSVLSTLRLGLKMRQYAESANCAILVPFPGTKVYEMALQNEGGIGLKTTDWSDFGKQAGFALRHANFAEGELQRYQSLFYILYYLGAPLKALRYFSFTRVFMVGKRVLGLHRS